MDEGCEISGPGARVVVGFGGAVDPLGTELDCSCDSIELKLDTSPVSDAEAADDMAEERAESTLDSSEDFAADSAEEDAAGGTTVTED